MKKYKIPSRSEKGVFRIIQDRGGGIYYCDCPSYKECYHIRAVKKYKKEVISNPKRCWYSHDVRRLEEHHLLRGADRQLSLTIFITNWIHRIATFDNDFAIHLTNLFFKKLNEKNMDIKLKARIKEIKIRNISSEDKEIRFVLRTPDLENAFKLAKLEPENLISITKNKGGFYAGVDDVRRKVSRKGDEAEILIQVAPAEDINAIAFATLKSDEEIDISFKDIVK